MKAAESLSRVEGELHLRVTQLSPEVARALLQSKYLLSLDKACEVSDETAEVLSGYTEQSLWLRGITQLSEAATDSLLKAECQINFEDPKDFVENLGG